MIGGHGKAIEDEKSLTASSSASSAASSSKSDQPKRAVMQIAEVEVESAFSKVARINEGDEDFNEDEPSMKSGLSSFFGSKAWTS